ncbi:MAG: class I SAM-dependent rRNA methyltransferase [Candidatus Dojkabacteria bacterium]|nr:class I SAM-dependent rRNA methyltransferase [Candidatus Dojkabacteria bacterium]
MNKKYKTIKLKKGKEIPINMKHHWIFSGSIDGNPDFENGEILKILDYKNQVLGYGYFNKKSQIIGRIISFGDKDPMGTLYNNILKSINMRFEVFDLKLTNCFRLINGEGDFIPGLIVDYYNSHLVLQISTIGIDKLKNYIVDKLLKIFKDRYSIKIQSIYEKSLMQAREKEGLDKTEGILYGKLDEQLVVLENGIKFLVNIKDSQKTGFFIDQREMREFVQKLSKDKKVLNCFGYTGGFSIYAIKGNATKTCTIDISEKAIQNCKQNFIINNIDIQNHEFISSDVFEYIQNTKKLDYDLVILDPPAFAKQKKDIQKAINAYSELNRMFLLKMPKKSILCTSSCSYHVNTETFLNILQKAARQAKRNTRIIQKHRLAIDHPINLNHPEIDYIKSFVIYIE